MAWQGVRSVLSRMVAIVFMFFWGCTMTIATAVDLKQAQARYAEGDFTEADRLYREALKSTPDDAEILEQLGTLSLWKNDLAGAEAYLKVAQRNTSWLGRRWPMNVRTQLHLAMAYSRAGRMREASALLDEAAGFFPIGSFKEIKTRARQLALFAEDTPYVMAGMAETSVPFVITDPLPVVKIAINSSMSAEFIIDTGAEGVVLDTHFAKEVGAVVVGEVPTEYAGAKKGTTGYGKVESIRVGEILVRNVPVSTLDLQPIASSVFSGREIKGIIGTGLLMQFLATIDYRNRQLILRKPVDSVKETTTRLGIAAQTTSFPMWLVETHLMFVQGSVNGLAPRLMFIDTGLAGGGFLTSKAIFTNAGITMDWSKAGMGAGGGGMTKALEVSVDQVSLGAGEVKIVKRDMQGVVFEEDMSLFKGELGFEVGGLVSHQFFRDYALTFDFRNMQMILQ